MGIFGRKKEKIKPEVLNISGEQLYKLLKKAVKLAAENIEANCYTTGPEIMFEYNNNVHFIGIKYDKKRAKSEKRVTFTKELMTVYVDKNIYQTLEELYDNANVDKISLNAITEGIIVYPEYKELL